MMKDPIVAEVRKARAELFARCDNDLGKLFRHLRRKQQAPGSKAVKPHRNPSKAA